MIIKAIASGSKGNAYYITDGKTPLLLECGIPIKELQIGTGFKLSQVGGVLISHQHNDHCKSISDCIRAGLDVYAPSEVYKVKKVKGRRCKEIHPLKGFTVGTFYILPFECDHDCVNYGFLLHSNHSGERLLYFTDTYMVKYKFDGVTHIMAECNYSVEAVDYSIAHGYIPASLKERLKMSHMSIDNLLEFLKANDLGKVQQIYLIHLSENNSQAEEFKAAVQKLTGKEVFVCG